MFGLRQVLRFPFVHGNFAEKHVLRLVKRFSCHFPGIKS